MNTKQIENELQYLKCFKGVFPIDLIKSVKIKEKPFAIIINLDYSYQPGSHWVAIYVNEVNELTYFDSFGFPNFNKYFVDFLRLNSIKNIIYNKYQIQSINSSSCGAFCILFVKMRCHGFSLNDFMKLFSSNKDRNDLISMSIFE